METRIYYFSSTGNSLALARDLANGLGGAELISMAKAAGTPVTADAERVGFVFPVIAWGLPGIVADFIRGLKFTGEPYVFAVATCGGAPGRTLPELRGLLRRAGADLHAGFACREGVNAVTDAEPGFIRLIKSMNRVRYPSGRERLPELVAAIREKRKHAPESSNTSVNLASGIIHGMMKMAGDKLKAYDNVYTVDDRCAGCRTCERVCPMGNVRVEAGRPVWHHDCAMCNACIQWCPQRAIHVANETCRYRNPAVEAAELFLR